MHEELIMSFGDLRFVCIKCLHCQTRIIMDMDYPGFSDAGQTFLTPRNCPGCKSAFDGAVPLNVDALRRVYLSIPKAVREAIMFHKGSTVATPEENFRK